MSTKPRRRTPCGAAVAAVLLCGSALAAKPPGPAARPLAGEADWTSVALSMGLPEVDEARNLVDAGTDAYGRRLLLLPGARAAWQAMQSAARADGVELVAISGFRSRARQAELVRAKLRRGMALRDALSINAVPGYSEHHGGYALDIGTPGSPAAEEVFERTAAFHWLQAHAHAYGFSMSYPRGNPHGICYEPWHWAWHDLRLADTATPAPPTASDGPGSPAALNTPDTANSTATPDPSSVAPPGILAPADASTPPAPALETPAEAQAR